jgi:hypothetical protein
MLLQVLFLLLLHLRKCRVHLHVCALLEGDAGLPVRMQLFAMNPIGEANLNTLHSAIATCLVNRGWGPRLVWTCSGRALAVPAEDGARSTLWHLDHFPELLCERCFIEFAKFHKAPAERLRWFQHDDIGQLLTPAPVSGFKLHLHCALQPVAPLNRVG